MSADELFDDDNWDYDTESEPSRKKKNNKPAKEAQDDFDDDWDDNYSQASHGKKRNRLRDIEDRLERKRLRRESTWDYDDLLN